LAANLTTAKVLAIELIALVLAFADEEINGVASPKIGSPEPLRL
jgi:hypothetical protein